jgi:DNA-binding LacI/PurR family transcriptional regulator
MASTLQPRTRLVDIAARAGVSATAVSTVLRGGASPTVRISPDTAASIRRIAAEMNYQPNMAAQQLRGQRSDVIGVLIGAGSTAANYERLFAIEQEAYRRGYRLMIGQFHGDSARVAQYIQDFVARGIDAMICFHNPLPKYDAQVLTWLGKVRSLVFQTEALLPDACCVDVDRAAGVREAVAHLVDRGRKRIALALNSIDDPLMQDRLRGYRAGLADHGLALPDSLVWAGDATFPPTRQLLSDAVDALLDRAHADAIIASNDVWAIELIKAMRRRGRRVPEDVAVIGFDNLPAAVLFDPGLTTIDQNNDAFAKAALDLLQTLIDTGKVPASRRRLVVQPHLVVREST